MYRLAVMPGVDYVSLDEGIAILNKSSFTTTTTFATIVFNFKLLSTYSTSML
jgi:hypothetical protein